MKRIWIVVVLCVAAGIACDNPSYYYTDSGVSVICTPADDTLVTYLPAGGGLEYDSPNASKSPGKLVTYTNVFGSTDGGLTWRSQDMIRSDGEPIRYNEFPNCSKLATSI